MKKKLIALGVLSILTVLSTSAQRGMRVRQNVPTDSIRLSDPAVLADKETNLYYMTGTGGMMWRSADLKLWEGPFRVTEFDKDSWMGPRPMIWAAELHHYKGKYYYFATFTNRDVFIGTVRGHRIERRACYVLVSDFVYTTDRNGNRRGWGVAEYSTPEKNMGEFFTENVYRRSPEESYERLLEHLRKLFPRVPEKDLRKFLK